jgi:homoserine dehydrogenase
VRVVVELIGGTGAAKELVTEALRLRKPVVTANKALLAHHGAEIFALAESAGTDIYFGASVGGGIPIVRSLRDGLVGNRIEQIHGILNGTCNYILTRMETAGLAFDDALKEAQAEGYAEADPSLDIDGLDTAHKAAILASLAHGFSVPLEAVHVEGIRGLSDVDIRYARDLGYRIKLLAVIRRIEASGEGTVREVEVRVHPTLVPLGHMLASVSGVFNAVMVRGDMVGETLFYGRGAGRRPTASTVIADIADVVRNLGAGTARRVLPSLPPDGRPVVREIDQIDSRYYLRMSVLDEPGVLGRLSTVLGQQGISIASVLQKEVSTGGGCVPVVILTHHAREVALKAALNEIDRMAAVGGPTVRIRLVD